MSKAIEESVALSFFYAVQQGDLEGAFSFTTDDVTFRPIGSHHVVGRKFLGKDDILQNCWMYVFQHLTEEGVSLNLEGSASGNKIAFVEFSGTGKGLNGTLYNNSYCHVYRFKGDKIFEITEYLDTELFNTLLSPK